MPYEDFVDHFWNLVPQLLSQPDLDDKALSKAIVAKGKLEGFQAGHTKVRVHYIQCIEKGVYTQSCVYQYLQRLIETLLWSFSTSIIDKTGALGTMMQCNAISWV